MSSQSSASRMDQEFQQQKSQVIDLMVSVAAEFSSRRYADIENLLAQITKLRQMQTDATQTDNAQVKLLDELSLITPVEECDEDCFQRFHQCVHEEHQKMITSEVSHDDTLWRTLQAIQTLVHASTGLPHSEFWGLLQLVEERFGNQFASCLVRGQFEIQQEKLSQ